MPAAAFALVVFAAGCGGAAKKTETETRTVRGPGYRFAVPAPWRISRRPHVVSAVRPGSAEDLVSVSTYRLPRVPTQAQIDAAAEALARDLKGKVDARKTVMVAGKAAPRYDLSYPRGDDELGLRLVFVLRGKREFQLLCRWLAPVNEEASSACEMLAATFRPV